MRYHLGTAAVLLTALAAAMLAPPPVLAEDKQAYLGVMLKLDEEKGIIILDVFEGSPAAKAGLKTGDQVIELDKMAYGDLGALVKQIVGRKPGDKITMKVKRDGEEKTFMITLVERPKT